MNSKREILDILRDDATTNEQTIAAMLGIGEDEVAAAIAELKEQGIIMKYSAILNSEAMGEEAPAEAMIEIKVVPKLDFGYEDIARRIYRFSEVKALYLMSGRYDFSIRVEAGTMKEISKFVWESWQSWKACAARRLCLSCANIRKTALFLKRKPCRADWW